MESIGEKIRNLREANGLPLRTVAAYLDIDQAILSKIERGQRMANRQLIVKITEYFKVNDDDLLVTWLSEKVVYELADEQLALEAIKVAEERIEYQVFLKIDRNELILKLKQVIAQFAGIKKAWIYGSFSRKDDGPKSDIDLAIETDNSISYFDLAEISHQAELAVNRKVDIGFLEALKPYILENVKPDLQLVYKRNDRNESLKRLLDIQKAIGLIQEYTENQTEKSFCADNLLNNAVLFQFTVIGEAIAYVEKEILEKYQYPWYKIRAFRNLITHEYFNIRLEAVWLIIVKDLTELKLKVDEILHSEFLT